MSSLQSLLQFRYERKGGKIKSKTNEDENGTESVDNSKTPEKSLDDKSSESSHTGTSSSPVFTKPETASPVFSKASPSPRVTKKKRPMRLDSESDDDVHSPVKESTDTAQWLSKEKAMNGHAPSNSSKSDTKSTSRKRERPPPVKIPSKTIPEMELDERELRMGINIIRSIFPSTSEEVLKKALEAAGGDTDIAINYIMDGSYTTMWCNKTQEFIRRRKSQESVKSSDSEVNEPRKKRARVMNFQDSDDDDDDDEDEEDGGGGMTGADPERHRKKIPELRSMFPHLQDEVFLFVLENCDGSVTESQDVLMSTDHDYLMAEAGVASQTKNVGSIRAFKNARAKNKSRKRIRRAVDSSDEEKPEKIQKNKKSKPKVMAKVANSENGVVSKMIIDDDDDFRMEDEFDDSDDDSNEIVRGSKEEVSILSFMNDAPLDELCTMKRCSKKKGEILVKLRPFDGLKDMTNKLDSTQLINMIGSCKQLLRIRAVVDRLMKECEEISEYMESLISDLTPNSAILSPQKDGAERTQITSQPSNINHNFCMKQYQLVGLNWLVLMHKQKLNGILADEMGLGKTIQAIALLAYLLESDNPGPHLIVVPASTLDNWLIELKRWCPDLKVVLYYGSLEERRDIRNQIYEEMEDFNVIITTYTIATGNKDDRNLLKRLALHFAIFDEGHMLKNMSSLRYKGLMKIKSRRRLLLTGTPLQNNLVELMSLLCFVMPDLFDGKTDYVKDLFNMVSNKSDSSRSGFEKDAIINAKRIMKPFVLRRLKSEVMKQLPQKIDLLERVPMSFEQQYLYDELLSEFVKAEQKGVSESGRATSVMMQLRKAANHHLLHRRVYDETKLRHMSQLMIKEPSHCDANPDLIFEDMEIMSDFELHKLCLHYPSVKDYALDIEQITDSGKFRYLDELLPTMKENRDRVLLFSQFTMVLDILEDYLKSRGYKFLRLDGSTPVVERQEMIDKYNKNEKIFVFLLSTKAGGLGINLVSANTVILHDIDYNPYNDKQAEDRCHRVGQTRNVTVYRLVSKNSIEEAMYKCAENKLKLEKDVTSSDLGDSESADVASMLKQAISMSSS